MYARIAWLTLALTAMDGGTSNADRDDDELMGGFLRLGCAYLPRLCRRLFGIATSKLPFD